MSHSTHTTGHFGDESFQTIDYTGTVNQIYQKSGKHYTHPEHKRQTEKPALAKQTKY